MKKCNPRLVSCLGIAGLVLLVGAQDQPSREPAPVAPDAPAPQELEAPAQPEQAAVAASEEIPATTPAQPEAAEPAPLAAAGTNADRLLLNFRAAPLELVLNYLSDAAGYIIQLNTPVSGKLDVWSATPVTREEAIALLNTALNRNGYAAVRNGRTLTIMTKEDAIHGNIPVKVSQDPASIPNNDEIVTQIIPIRFVEAAQLVKDLAPMVSPHATAIANEAGNSIILTDTQANIRHLAEIIKAIDSSAENMMEVRVFHLAHHDPTEVATLLTSLLADQGSSSGNQVPMMLGGFFGRGGPGGGRMGGGTATGSSNTQQDRIKKQQQVVAVADPRTSSVVVKAARDLMEQIAGMIAELDQESSAKTQQVSVFHLENADPQQVQQVLQDMFQSATSARSSSSTQSSPLQTRIQQSQSSSTTLGSGGSSSGIGTSRGGSGLPTSF